MFKNKTFCYIFYNVYLLFQIILISQQLCPNFYLELNYIILFDNLILISFAKIFIKVFRILNNQFIFSISYIKSKDLDLCL
jgi:hypothetical protein